MTSQARRNRVAVALASFGYVGFAPAAPGTVGSAAAFLLFVPLRLAAVPGLELAAAVVLFFAGVWAAHVTEASLGVEDPGLVVIDEVVGMLVSLLWLPLSWAVCLAAFLAFRVFDIVKPWPTKRFERLRGGWGIMADDVMAGVYANLVVQLLAWWRPEWMR
jgi:phosphatidylglycerophosphatase A